jgi:hypothetical protein
MINPNVKQGKIDTLADITIFLADLVINDLEVIVRHDFILHLFTIFIGASSYAKAKELYPALFKDKTAEYGKTIFVYYV